MKNTYYFPHDFNASNDIKLQKLIMKMSYEGLGLYWTIVEMLYKQGGKIELSECDSIAFAMRTDSEKIKQLIDIVFEKNENYFWSNSVLDRLKMIEDKSKKAKQSAKKRWTNQPKRYDANALQTQSEGNANKVKKSKVNKTKENKEEETKKYPLSYLSNIPEQDLEEFVEKFNCSKLQVKSKSNAVIDWCKGEGKKKKDYKSTLNNWLRRDYGERAPKQEFKPDLPVEAVSPEKMAEFRKNRQKLLGGMTT